MPFTGFPGSPHPWSYRTYFFASFSFNAACIAALFLAFIIIDQYLQYQHRNLIERYGSQVQQDTTEDDSQPWMVEMSLVRSQWSSSTTHIPRHRCSCLQRLCAVFFLLAMVFVWMVFSVYCVSDVSWASRWLVLCGLWMILSVLMFCMPRAPFFVFLRSALPLTFTYFLSLVVLQFSTWDYWSPWLVAFFTFFMLTLACLPLTRPSPQAGWKLPAKEKSCWRGVVRTYTRNRSGFTFTLLALLIYSILAPVFTAGSCISFFNPQAPGVGFSGIHWSTRISRSFENNACPIGKPCHVYLTVAEDLSTSVYVNVHTHPSVATVVVSYGLSQRVDSHVTATRFTINGLEAAGDRAVHSAFLTGLTPNSTYFLVVDGDSQIRRFRTAPADTDPFRFVTGGDMGNTQESDGITKHAIEQEPLFMVVGGDLAYTNGLRTCYDCWDRWLRQVTLATNNGYSVPILTIPGNHDTGSNSMDGTYADLYGTPDWNGDNPDIPLFFFYFPHHEAASSPSSPPPLALRRPYHAHKAGQSALFLALDSGYVTSYDDQVPWIEDELSNASRAAKIVFYHVPFYAYPFGNAMERGSQLGRPVWTKAFDRHRVHAAFENHVHAFKRTYPIRDDQRNDTSGCVYLGDGYWGISPHDTLGGANEGTVTLGGSPLMAVAGLRYHVWRADVVPFQSINLSAVGFTGIFDQSNIDTTPPPDS